MNLNSNNMLVDFEITCILVGAVIGLGIFNLPNVLIKDAYEAAWISAILGAIYPLYLGSLAIFICNKHPKDNILILSKKYFGRVIGSLLNFLFLLYFIIYTAIITSGFNNLYLTYIVSFLSPIKFVGITLFVAAITSYTGLKVIAKINVIAFFLTIFCMILTLGGINKGSYLNLLPILDISPINLLNSTKESFYSYGGLEIIFLIYPFAKNPKSMKKNIFSAIFIISVIYFLATFISIYYLGTDIIKKTNWALIYVIESINIPLFNNFRFVALFLWISIAIKVISNYYFSAVFVAKDLLKRSSRKHIIFVLYFILTIISIKLCEKTIRTKFIEMFYPKLEAFVIAYTTVIALFVFFKKESKN